MSARRFLSAFSSVALVLAFSANSFADSKAPQTAKAAAESFPTLKYEKFKLPNGLEVILSEDHRLPLVSVDLWYHVGPENEVAGRTGFAHLFEHMMFEGSKHVGSKAHFRYLEAAGATDINGTTGFDRTNYFETLPSNELELALWLESDRMGYLLDTLDQEKLANQRDVVRNERRQSIENVPYGLVSEQVYHELFPKGHPYYARVIGSHADVEAARLADVRKFFETYYTPNNASLAIAGDFNPKTVRALVEKYFGSLKPGPAVPKVTVVTPPITHQRRAVVTDQVELPRVYMAWITAPIFKPGDADTDVLSILLGGGKSSRLYKKLVYEKQIAQDVYVENESLALGSVFEIIATAKPGVKPEELEKAIDDELAELRKTGPTQAEVDRARNTIQSDKIRRLEVLGGFGGVADTLNSYNHYLGDPGYLAKDLARYNAVSVKSIQQIAENTLKTSAGVVVYGVPGKKEITDVPKTDPAIEAADSKVAVVGKNADEPWRDQPPRASVASNLALPVPVSFKLSNGLTVMLAEQHNLPVLTADLVTLTGSEANPVDKPGLASFTANMLTAGTKTRSALQIADDSAQLGTELNTGSTTDNSYASLEVLKRNTNAAFDLLSDIVLHPAFEPQEIERIRSRRLTGILQEKDSPNTLARKASYLALYGPNSPYGYIESGTEASNKAITRDDLVNFWKTGYTPENSALIVSGDITKAELKTLAEKYFGGWTGSSTRHDPLKVDNNVKPGILIMDKPGAPQTALRFASIAAPRSTPDYVPLMVLNTALGGTFSSRLNMNLREKHGYTYGAFSGFLFRRAPGPFIAQANVRTDVTSPAVHEAYGELERIRSAPITADELSMAKSYFSQSLVARFETTAETASTMGEIFTYDLPLDYYSTLPSKIDAVTAADVQRVAGEYLKPDSMVTVAVGDRAKIESELQKLNLAPVALIDTDGKLINKAAAAEAK